jgi:carbonic anhydrase
MSTTSNHHPKRNTKSARGHVVGHAIGEPHPVTFDGRPRGHVVGHAIGEPRRIVHAPDDPTADNFDVALARNREFAFAGGHEGAVVFPNLRLFVVTCLDPRVDPAHFLGLSMSDAMVVRNVGGRVTPEVINDVAFVGQLAETMLPDGPLFEVAVIQHTQCGAGAFADDGFRHTYAARIGAEESSLREHAVLDPTASVVSDIERLRSARAISPRVIVSGHVYDVVTGLVETVVPGAPIGVRDVQWEARNGFDDRSLDPTQGRRSGSHAHDDPTQGRRLGSRPGDDPTRPR